MKPFLILIDGPMGAGKTTTAKALHQKLDHSALVSLDRIKHFVSGVKVDNQEDLQLASEIGAVITREYLNRGINTIVEKAFTFDKFLREFIKMTGVKNAKILVYQVEAPIEIRRKRVKERPLPEGVEKMPTEEKLQRNTYRYTNFKYKKASVFDSSKLSTRQIVNRILKDIK